MTPYSGADDFEYQCVDVRGNENGYDGASVGSSQYGLDSRCVNVVNSADALRAYCFQMECTGWDETSSSYSGVDITIDSGTVVSCTKDNALSTVAVSGVSGLASIQCPNTDTICGSTTKPFQCKYGTYDDTLGRCVCSPGYSGDSCSDEDTSLVSEASLADAVNYNVTRHTKVCIAGIKGSWRSFNGVYKVTNQLNEGVTAYYNPSINYGTYLFYRRYDQDWSLGDVLGDGSRFGYCEKFIGPDNDPNIEECGNWYMYKSSTGDFAEMQTVQATYDVDSCEGNTDVDTDNWDGSNEICLYSLLLIICFSFSLS